MPVNLGTTTRHGIRYPTAANVGIDLATGIADTAADVDALVTPFSQGLFSARPVSTPGSPGKVGRRYYATDVGLEFVDLGTSWIVVPVRLTGEMMDWPVATPPAGWLTRDGSSQVRTTYPALSALLLPVYGSVDGTHFNLPNHVGRVLVGAGTGAGLTARVVGATGGEEAHVLSAAEMPVHNHAGEHGSLFIDTASTGVVNANVALGGGQYTQNTVTDPAGSGAAHNNMPPFAVVTPIIKT